MFWFLVVLAAAFIGFAVVTQYNKTPTDQSVPKRVWLSVVAAAGVIGAAVATFFKSGAAP